jgi:polysaccharide biosynthesis/export protein
MACTVSLAGCSGPGGYVWYSQLPASEWAPPADQYVLGVGDSIDIRVYDQPQLSVQGRIRQDGRLSVPLVGEIVAAGKAPAALALELETRIKQFIVSPRVSVNVTESTPITISVLGEVGSRGSLTLTPPATLIQALAQSGGLTEFADDEAIYVLRKTPTFRRIRFKYEALTRNEGGAAAFPLRSGDVIVVE